MLSGAPGSAVCTCRPPAQSSFESLLGEAPPHSDSHAMPEHMGGKASLGRIGDAVGESVASPVEKVWAAVSAPLPKDADKTVQYGLNLSYRIRTKVMRHVGLLPVSGFDQVESAACSTMIRQLAAPLVPSTDLASFQDSAVPEGDERPASERGFSLSESVVAHVKAFAEKMAAAMPAIPPQDEVLAKQWSLVSFFVKAAEFGGDNAEEVSAGIVADVLNQKAKGVLVAADVVLEQPCVNVMNVVLRVVADPRAVKK